MLTLQGFDRWEDVIAHVRARRVTYYHAPLDYRAARVSAAVRKDSGVLVLPRGGDCDPFVADAGHLDRFRRMVR